MIAEAAATVPLLLYEGDQEHDSHPLLDLLARPNPDHTGPDFLENWFGFLLVSGNAYAEVVSAGGTLREVHVLRPDRMKVVPGAEGWPEGYEYTAGGQSVRFTGEALPGVRQILHMRLFHPVNDYYGMSPIEAAATAIDIHNTASNWNKALLDNSARPSGALVYGNAGQRLNPEQFERLKLELEQGFAGASNAGRPLLLEGGLDWKPLSLSPKDMDFIEAKNSAAREIALALGVPPMLLGIPGDNTYDDDPYDPGGPTNKGITLRVFAEWKGVTADAPSLAKLKEELKRIPDRAARDIYHARYWQTASCPSLPRGLSLMHFDAAVNHGVGTANRFLQEALGVVADGEIGPNTLAAAAACSVPGVLDRYAAVRRKRYRSLNHFWRFGRGWLARVDATLAAANSERAAKLSPTEKGPTPMPTSSMPDTTVPTASVKPKWWGDSITIWGAMISALATVVPVLASAGGITLTPDLVRDFGTHAAAAVQAAVALIGTIVTIYGRLRATQPLERRAVRLKI